MAKNITVGWIGTGVIGASMVSHLHKAGYNCVVYNRTKAKAEPLLSAGMQWADTSADVAKQADIIFTTVGFPQDVYEVYFAENGIFSVAKPGKTVVDMTTTEPSIAVEIYQTAKTKGLLALDAPVSGGDVGAKNATLSIMVGGDKEVFDKVLPFFELMGTQIVYQGEAGAGQHTKMCNQITIAGTMIGVCESLLYGFKAGLDLPTMLSSISGGAAGCWTLDNLAPRIVERNFDPGFFVEHFIKDMGIALKEAEVMGLSLPGLALVKQLYMSVQAQGNGRLGTHALMLALEKMSGIEGEWSFYLS